MGTSVNLHITKKIRCSVCGGEGKIHTNGTTQQSGMFSVRCVSCDNATLEFCFIYKAWKDWSIINKPKEIGKKKELNEKLWKTQKTTAKIKNVNSLVSCC